jgi:ubiquinone biosynthesis protein COQ9
MPKKVDLAPRILNKALEIAEASSWETLHLYDIAATLNISLDQVREHYQQKDDLVEAWFDRADSAMLRDAASPEFAQLSGRERIHRVIMTWLQALGERRRVTAEMLCYKLEFGHVHLQVLGIMRVSRTVQWFREAAHQKAAHFQRILEEVGLTSIYLATFAYWLRDDSPGSENTGRFLDGLLRQADALSGSLKRVLVGNAGVRPPPVPERPDIDIPDQSVSR